LIFPLLASASADVGAAARRLRLESHGSNHRVYFNGTLALSYTESSYTSGQPGIAGSVFGGPTVKMLSFIGGALTGNGPAVISTTTTLSGSSNPSSYGQSVTLTATVLSSNSISPTGTVTFAEGNSVLGTAGLDGSGKASIGVSSFSVGQHRITATDSGDGGHNPGSGQLTQTVTLGPTTTALLLRTANPSIVGQEVRFSATVTATYGGSPSGNVAFFDGATPLGSSALVGGSATFNTTVLTVGTHAITAVYSGDSNFGGSTSAALSGTVNPVQTNTSLALKPAITYGQSVTFTATITQGYMTAIGTVTLTDGGTAIGTVALNSSNQAACKPRI
jgi:Bacterial Ig-like domain (group 3)